MATRIIYFVFFLLIGGSLFAQEKRQIDLSVEILEPFNDSSYYAVDPVPFRVLLANNGPDHMHPNDTFIYMINNTQTFLGMLTDSLLAGQSIVLYDGQLSSGGQTGEHEICVYVLGDNEQISLDGGTTYLNADWIDPTPGNNEHCVMVKLISKPTSVVIKGEDDFPIKVLPNPARDKVNIQLDNMLPGVYNLRIFSISGRQMLDQDIRYRNPGDEHQIDVSRFAPGNYYIQLNGGDKNYKTQLIIQR